MRFLKRSPIFIISLGLVHACSPTPEIEVKEAAIIIPVKVIPINETNSLPPVMASGLFTSNDEVILSFKTGGVVRSITVNEGDAVKKGQLLATLNMTEINAQVKQAQLALEKAERDHKRAGNLYNDSVATREQFENSKTGLELAQQQYKAAKFNQSFSEIRATADGYVLEKKLNPGQLAGPGAAVIKTNGAGHGKWLLKVSVSDGDWRAIQVGDSALVQVKNDKLKARVLRKSQGIDPLNGGISVDLEIVDKQVLKVASGMFAKASIYPQPDATTSNSVWSIPYGAILDGDGSSAYVFVTNDRKTAHKQKVTISGIAKNKVLISDGLEGFKELIMAGSAYLTEGSPIEIIE